MKALRPVPAATYHGMAWLTPDWTALDRPYDYEPLALPLHAHDDYFSSSFVKAAWGGAIGSDRACLSDGHLLFIRPTAPPWV